MQAPTHMPGEAPNGAASAPQEPPRITYLRDPRTGKDHVWTEQLAEGNPAWMALDQYKRVVPKNMHASAPVSDAMPDPSAAIDGMVKQHQMQHVQAQLDMMREQIAALQTEVQKLGG